MTRLRGTGAEEEEDFRKKKFHGRVYFRRGYVCLLATELTGPLCKLQREERASVCSPPPLAEVAKEEGRKN